MNFYKEQPPLILSQYDIEFFRAVVDEAYISADAHIHSAIEILYITEGIFEIYIDGRFLEAHSGDMVLLRSNAVHTVHHPYDSHGEYYVIKLTTQYLFNIFKGAKNTDCLLVFLRNKKNEQILFKQIPSEIKNILDNMIEEHNSGAEMMMLTEKAYISILIISLFRMFFLQDCEKGTAYLNRDMIARIHKSAEYVNLNYASNITATECAKNINLSYSYYAKLFRIIIGKSFKEYLCAIRMANAYSLLISTDMPITDVALSCGYNNHAYFTAEYKRYYGKTPTETRKNR